MYDNITYTLHIHLFITYIHVHLFAYVLVKTTESRFNVTTSVDHTTPGKRQGLLGSPLKALL